jgi:hypothetical protein
LRGQFDQILYLQTFAHFGKVRLGVIDALAHRVFSIGDRGGQAVSDIVSESGFGVVGGVRIIVRQGHRQRAPLGVIGVLSPVAQKVFGPIRNREVLVPRQIPRGDAVAAAGRWGDLDLDEVYSLNKEN